MLKNRSLKSWIAASMVIAVLPLAISAGAGYLLLNKGVIGAFEDVADRQRNEVVPAQRLRLLIWDAVLHVDEFVEDANPLHQTAYRETRTKVESGFAELGKAARDDEAILSLMQRARDQWNRADAYASDLISVTDPEADVEIANLQRFHGAIRAASDDLSAVFDQISEIIEADHDAAILAYERAKWLAGIAAGLSILCVIAGVVIIGRVIAGSVDRLVKGAAKFAEGDREHRIDVQVPPELHKVAEEFNHMISRIRESEAALSSLAHHDSLTGLPNRRAFDEGLSELWARKNRFAETGALLAIDIDHFKQVNDTYGHAAGDDVLRAVARTMRGELRAVDKLFRTGGEEFSALLPGVNEASALEVAERLREAVAGRTLGFRNVELSVTISIGCAFSSDAKEQSDLVDRADRSLYQAKLGGRNRVVLDMHMSQKHRGAA